MNLYSIAHGVADAVVMLLIALGVALLLAVTAVLELIEALIDNWLGVAIVVLAVTLFAGCGTAPTRDARDPEIFRPTQPVYPMPDR